MSGLLTNEMSALKSGCGNMFHQNLKEARDGNILPKARTGAGNEGARGNLKGNKWPNPLGRGGRDSRHNRQTDEAVEKKV